MKNYRRFSALVCGIALIGLAQCGSEDSLSGQIDFFPEPDDPVVVNASLTVNAGLDNEFVASAPWFRFGYYVKNGSDKTLYLQSFRFEIETEFGNAPFMSDTSLDPTVFCDVDGSTPGRYLMALLPAGAAARGHSDGCDLSTYNTDDRDIAYIYGLPNTDVGIYQVKISGQGWFENSAGDQLERLTVFRLIHAR